MLPIISKTSIEIRVATMADLPAIDALQKQFGKALGYFPTAQLKGYIEMGGVLAARDADTGVLLGYIISRDRYLKRDELGVIYQLCVAPSAHRQLIGASLVKAAFERSAYGCRLFCLWCAQDLEANRFWESLGFVPIAFRAGGASKGKRRVHIFWQRRVRADDVVTPYWFPAQTSSGAIREDRLVLPIPVGVHWSDEMPILLPRNEKPIQKETARRLPAPANAQEKRLNPTGLSKHDVRQGGIRFDTLIAQKPAQKCEPKPKPKREAVKIDPRIISAARELRDRWLERVNGGEIVLTDQRYEVSRIESQPPAPQRLLPAA